MVKTVYWSILSFSNSYFDKHMYFATLATVACTVYSTTFCPYAFIRKSEKSSVQNVVF